MEASGHSGPFGIKRIIRFLVLFYINPVNFIAVGETGARCYRGRLLQSSLNFFRLDYHFDDEVADVF